METMESYIGFLKKVQGLPYLEVSGRDLQLKLAPYVGASEDGLIDKFNTLPEGTVVYAKGATGQKPGPAGITILQVADLTTDFGINDLFIQTPVSERLMKFRDYVFLDAQDNESKEVEGLARKIAETQNEADLPFTDFMDYLGLDARMIAAIANQKGMDFFGKPGSQDALEMECYFERNGYLFKGGKFLPQ